VTNRKGSRFKIGYSLIQSRPGFDVIIQQASLVEQLGLELPEPHEHRRTGRGRDLFKRYASRSGWSLSSLSLVADLMITKRTITGSRELSDRQESAISNNLYSTSYFLELQMCQVS
jgi:hypothetical protein